jgi:transposase InsO family protein
MCQELLIKHLYTRPYRPQTNGKIEAFFRILKDEFFYPNSFDSEYDLIMNLGNFLFEYNHLRKHGGLNYETPFDKLQKVTELLS